MAKPNLGAVISSIVDPMVSDNFDLSISSVPGGGGNVTPLLMQCQQATKPGMTVENVEVALFGHTIEYAGRMTFSHDLSVTYVENRKAEITNLLEGWAQYIRETQSQHGHYKADYMRDAKLTIYDQTGATVSTYNIKNCWVATVPEVQFDGSSANLITLQASFKYDWYEKV